MAACQERVLPQTTLSGVGSGDWGRSAQLPRARTARFVCSAPAASYTYSARVARGRVTRPWTNAKGTRGMGEPEQTAESS